MGFLAGFCHGFLAGDFWGFLGVFVGGFLLDFWPYAEIIY
jgi:hypothetical protein